jgi:hypothetical protein
MTEGQGLNEDVFRRARELEARLWHSPKASAQGETPEREFVDFLRAHRSELESDSYWQAYIEDLDRVRLLEPPGASDRAEQRRTERSEWTQGSSTDAPATPPADRAARGRRP